MSYHVQLTSRAESDIDSILDYLRIRSQQGAVTWANRLSEVLVELESNANHCVIAPENEGHVEEIRQVVFKTRRGRNYRLLFFIRFEDVFVTHVRGPGQDIVY